MTDEYWMQYAISLASKAEQLGEVPVGALLVKNNEVQYRYNNTVRQPSRTSLKSLKNFVVVFVDKGSIGSRKANATIIAY